ncbi:MAG: hypothetical protein COV71_02605 [Candidatus Omnitrophica bacterium CG11_big_fil_rev_8_21_14_0_20_41_12]|nr:MAG: hypothetical protein COV71_02605 [Candidatus Omnitrophica bacterium CG11_big_fil_rev_8_21_14_0_20_41_12]
MNIEAVGSKLKKIRQERGLTLEDMQKKTKVHPNVLRAIEGDSISDLSPIYLKGFIKIYCTALGLDPKEYTGPLNPTQKPVLNATIGRPIGGRSERMEKKPSFIKDTSIKLSTIKPLYDFRKIIIIGISALVCLFLVVNLVKFMSSRRKTPLEKAKVLMAFTSAKNNTVKQQADAKKGLTQEIIVGVFARQKSWISAKADGKTIFHGVLARGRSQTWHAKEKVELTLSDAGAVELQVNDERISNLGRPGKPLKNILINKDGLKAPR